MERKAIKFKVGLNSPGFPGLPSLSFLLLKLPLSLPPFMLVIIPRVTNHFSLPRIVLALAPEVLLPRKASVLEI